MSESINRRNMLGLALTAPVAIPMAIASANAAEVHGAAACAILSKTGGERAITVFCDTDSEAKISIKAENIIIDIVKRAHRRGQFDRCAR